MINSILSKDKAVTLLSDMQGMMQKVCVIYPKAEVNDADAIASVSRKSWSGRYGVEINFTHSNDALIVVATRRWAGFFGKMTWDIVFQGQNIGQVGWLHQWCCFMYALVMRLRYWNVYIQQHKSVYNEQQDLGIRCNSGKATVLAWLDDLHVTQ